jgi:proline iminopeptidase
LSELRPAQPALPDSLYDANAQPGMRVPRSPYMEWHYIKHDFFLAPGQLLRDAGRLAPIPGIIAQGRYDLLCPPETATRLAAAWGNADLRIAEGAGHAASEPSLRPILVEAIAELGRRLV